LVDEQWTPLVELLLKEVFDLATRLVAFACKGVSSINTADLDRSIEQRALTAIDEVRSEAQGHLMNILNNETDPYTLNVQLFEEIIQKERDSWIKDLQPCLQPSRSGAPPSIDSVVNLKISTNCNEYAINHLTNILNSYWKVASRRIIDAIPMTVHNAFMKKFPIRILDSIVFDSDEELEQLLVDDPLTKRSRQDLREKIAELKKGEQTMKEILLY
jgi:hypothetical protein